MSWGDNLSLIQLEVFKQRENRIHNWNWSLREEIVEGTRGEGSFDEHERLLIRHCSGEISSSLG
jgi:hypothetical protein